MSIAETLRALEQAATARTRAAYVKAGADGVVYGASAAALRSAARRHGPDQAHAEALWGTGVFDARLLAARLAEPARLTGRVLSEWVAEVRCGLLAEAVAELAVQHPGVRALAAGWRVSSEPWVASIGWSVLARQVPVLSETEVSQALAELERRAPTVPSLARGALSAVLVAVGALGDRRRTLAIDAARRVSHGLGPGALPDVEAQIMAAATERAAGERAARAVASSSSAASRPPAHEPARSHGHADGSGTSESPARAARRPPGRRGRGSSPPEA